MYQTLQTTKMNYENVLGRTNVHHTFRYTSLLSSAQILIQGFSELAKTERHIFVFLSECDVHRRNLS